MQPLESEPLALRVSVIQEWSIKTLNRADFLCIRILEDACHFHRVHIVKEPRELWIYGFEDSAVELSIADGPERHQQAARFAYLDNVMTVTNLLKHLQPQRVCDMYKTLGISFWTTADASFAPAKESFESWESQLTKNLDFAKKILEEKETSTKGIFQCPSCKSQDVDTEQKQTRSADEPMTIFCHCTQCNKKFVR